MFHVLVKAPPWVQCRKNNMKAWWETNTAQDEAQCCNGVETHTRMLFFFHIAQLWQCFNWFIAFLVDKLFVLVTFSNSKMLRMWPTVLKVFAWVNIKWITVLFFPHSTLQKIQHCVWKICISFIVYLVHLYFSPSIDWTYHMVSITWHAVA